jgi:hypothetical protein
MIDTLVISDTTLLELKKSTDTLTIKDWASLIALFSSAIFAVLIGQYLQDRKAKKDRSYQNKFSIFATILGLRHAKGNDENFVIAINQVTIVFHDNKKVLQKLERFTKSHKDLKLPKSRFLEEVNSDLNDLVLEMAKDLDYTNIDNNVMKTYFCPDTSFFRHGNDAVYNEYSYLEKLPLLNELRLQTKSSSSDKGNKQED